MENPGNQGSQQDQQPDQHGSSGRGEGFDSGLEAYAHSADQSMGYLETEQQGQTEDYGDEPYGAYERGGVMNAGNDRYTPPDSSEQTRLPDLTGQPGAGPWATEPPSSEPPGANEQAISAEYAAWHPPAVSAPGVSANPGQPTADTLRMRELRQTIEMRHVPTNPSIHPGAPIPPEVAEQQGQPPQPGIYAGERQITGDATATSGGRHDIRSGEARLASAEQSGDTGQANPAPMPQVDTDAPTTEQANREHGAPLGLVPDTGHNADGGDGGDETAGASGGQTTSSGQPAVVGEGQPEVASRQVPISGKTAEQGQAQPPRIQPTPPGGNTAAERVLQRDTQELQRQQQQQQGAQAGGQGQSGARKQPAGTVIPTDKHAEAMLDARTRIHDAIDQLASQIPYGEEFAQQAKETTDTALDTMEAQALQRAAELSRDVTATP
ncbi:MAG TPA: hypothetical protein VF116_11515 [Ktedonobacterales bacterium]